MTTRRPGFWKPYLTGTLTGAAATIPALATGNIPAAISSALAGGKAGYNVHEEIRQKYNIPWLGKRGRRKTKCASKRMKKSGPKKSRKKCCKKHK